MHPLIDEKANINDLPHIKRGWLFVDFRKKILVGLLQIPTRLHL
jgi:hypothetical protein